MAEIVVDGKTLKLSIDGKVDKILPIHKLSVRRSGQIGRTDMEELEESKWVDLTFFAQDLNQREEVVWRIRAGRPKRVNTKLRKG